MAKEIINLGIDVELATSYPVCMEIAAGTR